MKGDRRFGVERNVQLTQLLERREISPDTCCRLFFFGLSEIDTEDFLRAVERGWIDPGWRLRLLPRERGSRETTHDGGGDCRQKPPALHTPRTACLIDLSFHESSAAGLMPWR